MSSKGFSSFLSNPFAFARLSMHSLKVDSYNRVLFVALEERAAAIPSDERARLSEPEAQYAIYMMEKYDDDYKVRCTILQEKKELIH